MTDAIRSTFNPLFCGSEVLTFVGDNGVITSPGFPGNYTNKHDCHYRIEVPEGHKVEINVVDFTTEQNHDILAVYNGARDDPNSQLYQFTGSMANLTLRRLVSTGNQVFLKFVTDGTVVKSGWRLEFQSVNSSGNCFSMLLSSIFKVTF